MKKFLDNMAKVPVLKFFLNNRNFGFLLLKLLILAAVPYVWLYVMSWVHGSIWMVPEMAPFILYSSFAFWGINAAIFLFALLRFCLSDSPKSEAKKSRKKK